MKHALNDLNILTHVPLSWDDFTLVIHSIYDTITVMISNLSAGFNNLRDSMVRVLSLADISFLSSTHLYFTDAFGSNTALEYATTTLAPSSALGQSNLLAGQLGPYLAGLLESDGSFTTPSILGNTPTIYISFNLDDLPFAEFLRTMLGGSIQMEPNAHAFRLVFRSSNDILHIIQLINGHMRTPKIEALHAMIN